MKINLRNAYISATSHREEVYVAGDWPNTLILRGDDAERFRQEYAEQFSIVSDGNFKMELCIDVEFE